MPIMQFDSHRGWYNPNPRSRGAYSDRFYAASAPIKIRNAIAELSDSELDSLRGGYRVKDCSIDAANIFNREAAHNELCARGKGK